MDEHMNMEVELNRNSFSDYLKKRFSNRHILFDDRPHMLDELIAELRIRGCETIKEIDRLLNRTVDAAELFEKDHPPNLSLEDSKYSAIGIVRMSMLLLDDDFYTFKKTIFDDGKIRENLSRYRELILPDEDVSKQ